MIQGWKGSSALDHVTTGIRHQGHPLPVRVRGMFTPTTASRETSARGPHLVPGTWHLALGTWPRGWRPADGTWNPAQRKGDQLKSLQRPVGAEANLRERQAWRGCALCARPSAQSGSRWETDGTWKALTVDKAKDCL